MKTLYKPSILIAMFALSACVAALDKNAGVASPADGGSSIVKTAPALGFPYANPRQADFIHCFGICPWNNSSAEGADNSSTSIPADRTPCQQERHIGIDIYPKSYSALALSSSPTSLRSPQAVAVTIVAPADALVEQIGEGETGCETKSLLLALRLSRYWYVVYSFEPHSKFDYIWELQRRSLLVSEGQRVKQGEVVGSLVVSEKTVIEPSLHYSLFYLEPGQSLDELHEVLKNNIETVNVSDGTDLEAAGSPWDNRELKIPTTFFCPEAFSSADAIKEYRRLPARDRHGASCSSTCAYNSTDGNCGTAQTP